ncbi:MAG: hypothetical protein ACD_78C00305G0001 [uncultured bacterium (gcode 4)]|uniref:Uncharacterized protein n=1 Tax=uncultured bacterium (gcode 4) TaxID=1234023 RepID=K1XHD1_9BACT|nr:MAG: hypothetical protein ACD_78C00305G0001 [uncultured bacterium (gcode 4)]
MFFGSESDTDTGEIIEGFPLSDISLSGVFSDLRIIGYFVIEKVLKIFIF